MVSVLAIRPKVYGFKLGQGSGFLRAIKVRSQTSFGGDVKPEAPCCKIIWHVWCFIVCPITHSAYLIELIPVAMRPKV
jgi:hypothetical protein